MLWLFACKEFSVHIALPLQPSLHFCVPKNREDNLSKPDKGFKDKNNRQADHVEQVFDTKFVSYPNG